MKKLAPAVFTFSIAALPLAANAQTTGTSQYQAAQISPQYAGDIQPTTPDLPKWKMSVGAGTVYSPEYVGSKDNSFKVFPDIRIEYKDMAFLNAQDGLGYNAFQNDFWRLGPLLKIDWGRKEDSGSIFSMDTDTTELRGLGDVDITPELGGFAEYKIMPQLSTKFELRQGFGGHEGLVSDLNLDYTTRSGDIILSFGPRMKFADENYINAYFGVTPTQSIASGLAVYNADGGLFSYGIGAAAIMPLADSFKLTAFIGYDRLADDIAESPLVDQRGSPDQAAVGTALTYDFTVY